MAHKLLLADDSITIQRVVELILSEEGFEVRSVSNGEDAMSLLSTFRPDIVLADIEMPRMNGYQLCDRIKNSADTASLPVILLAGAFEPIDRDRAKSVAADGVVIKPFESQELVSKIRSALDLAPVLSMEKAGGEGETLRAGDISDDDLWAMEMDDVDAVPGKKVWGEKGGNSRVPGNEPELHEHIENDLETIPGNHAFHGVDKDISHELAPGIKDTELVFQDDMREVFEDLLREKMESVDIQAIIRDSLAPFMKEAVEKAVLSVAPGLIEQLSRDMLTDLTGSLRKEVEKVLWDTLPTLAETMISKEIERLRSEF